MAAQSSVDPTRDPETLGREFEGIRLFAGGISLIYATYLVYNSTRLELRVANRIMLLDAVALLVCSVTFWLVHTRRVETRRTQLLAAILALTVSLNVASSVAISGRGDDLQFMMVVVMGGAAVVASTGWLTYMIALPIALGLLATVFAGLHGAIANFLASQIGASIGAIVIYLGRVRGLRRVLLFRNRDAQTNRELKIALERAEREFVQHQATERKRLELLEQLRHAQKLEALGTLAGGVAHDINNVIGGITAIASVMVHSLAEGAPGRDEFKEILTAAKRSTTLTRNLVRFARQDAPRNAPFELDQDVVAELEPLLRRTLAKHIQLRTNCGALGWCVMGDAGLVSHALMNLCLNSADAIADHGEIAVTTRSLSLQAEEAKLFGIPPGDCVEISVTDSGHGMTAYVRERAFEPFFSTKEGQRRSGLGLPMVYGTVQQHGGGITVESEPEKGTRIRIVLPATRRTEGTPARPPERKTRATPNRPVALFVDDEPLLRKAGRRMLMSLGYEVVLATNGQEALERYLEQPYRVGVAVLDIAMPVMSGADCCRELKRLDPQLPILLASGFPKGADLHALISLGSVEYLKKPYTLDELVSKLSILAESFRDSTRIACQVNRVRVSRPPPHG